MSIAQNFPNLKPTLLLDFSNTEALDSRVTFTRASTATYYGTQTAKAEENLLVQSQTFDTANWTANGTTITANTEVAPDGTTTADTLTGNGASSAHVVQPSVAINFLASTYTVSVFAKAGTNNFIQLRFFSPLGAAFANFNLATGAVGTSGAGATASIQSVGSGWYRCIMTATTTASPSGGFNVWLVTSDSAASGETNTLSTSVYLWGAQLEQRSAVTAYTATTTQPITNYIPVLQTAASGVARFDHNPTTFESLGLLIEESRTNLVTYSEQFDNAAWAKIAVTITANTIVAPDGALMGDKLLENTAASVEHYLSQGGFPSTNQTYTRSIYVKAAETPSFVLQTVSVGASSTTSEANFSVLSGVISVSSTNGLISSASATPVGNGWYRCIVVYTLNGTVTSHSNRIFPRAMGLYTGDGYSGIYIWGAQLEAGSFATSYIPTVASQVTRAADVAVMTGTNFSSWYNQAEGTLFAEWTLREDAVNASIYQADDGTNSNLIRLRYGATGTGNDTAVIVGGVVQTTTTATNQLALNTTYKNAMAYKLNDFARSASGAAVITDSAGTIPTVTQLGIGRNATNGEQPNCTIRKIAYYPIRVTNSQLQALAS